MYFCIRVFVRQGITWSRLSVLRTGGRKMKTEWCCWMHYSLYRVQCSGWILHLAALDITGLTNARSHQGLAGLAGELADVVW